MAAASGPALRHFLDLDRIERATLRQILDAGCRFKGAPRDAARPLAGKALALIFEKPSTRTRVSFELAMRQLGGDVIVLERDGSQLGRGETVADTARVLSRYVDAIMLRTTREEKLLELAEHATVPVINGLTDRTHPCQLMADVMTVEEHLGPIAGKIVVWSGDGNNMATSWIHAAVQFGFELRLACPEQLTPPADVLRWAERAGGRITVGSDVDRAVRGADCVVTDTWVSMGDGEVADRHNLLAPFRVDERLMRLAKPEAIFLHCLPAHRGEEVTAGVIDGPRSAVWDEAENRLHAQKAILTWCLDAS
jgi:ornithine carbamoyltransferase